MAQENQDFERLKQKYQPAFNLMQQLHVKLQNLNMDGDKLLIRGLASSAEAKSKVWDQIKLIDVTFSDLVCDLRVSEQAPDTMAPTVLIMIGQDLLRGTVKPAARLSMNQPRVIRAPRSVREIIQRKTRSPPESGRSQHRRLRQAA
jgi:hypothetical protein